MAQISADDFLMRWRPKAGRDIVLQPYPTRHLRECGDPGNGSIRLNGLASRSSLLDSGSSPEWLNFITLKPLPTWSFSLTTLPTPRHPGRAGTYGSIRLWSLPEWPHFGKIPHPLCGFGM